MRGFVNAADQDAPPIKEANDRQENLMQFLLPHVVMYYILLSEIINSDSGRNCLNTIIKTRVLLAKSSTTKGGKLIEPYLRSDHAFEEIIFRKRGEC